MDLLRNTANKITGARKLHKAQQATLQMIGGLSPRSPRQGANTIQKEELVDGKPKSPGTSRSPASQASLAGSPAKMHSATDHSDDEDDILKAGAKLREDLAFREWAQEKLRLPPERLRGLEGSSSFRARMEHQMLCWYALRANEVALPLPSSALGSAASADVSAVETLRASGCSPRTSVPSVATKEKVEEPTSSQVLSRALSLKIPAIIPASFGLSAEASETAPEAPTSPSVRSNGPSRGMEEASKALFGLSRYDDFQSARRARLHQRLASDALDDPGGLASSEPGALESPSLTWQSARLPSVGQTRDGAYGISLRRPPPFKEPHRHLLSQDIESTPEFAYFRRCERSNLVPCAAVWRPTPGAAPGAVGGHARFLEDADVVALVETAIQGAQNGKPLRSLDLGGNALTAVGFGRIAQLFAAMPEVASGSGLVSLSLAGNASLRLTSEAMLNDVEQAFRAMPELRSVDLSRVPLGGKPVMRLAAALGERPALRRLVVADCGLGRMDQRECSAIAVLLGSRKLAGVADPVCLVEADLSMNFFGRVGFQTVSEALQRSTLEDVSFLGNGGMHMLTGCQGTVKEQQARFHPVQLLLEGLMFNKSLTRLDLSACGVGPDSCFVLEEALMGHPAMKQLELADNPLGDEGLRSIMRLLVPSACRITSCQVNGHGETDPASHRVKFRHAQPGGIYNLDLRYPHQRATLRKLLYLSEQSSRGGFRAGPLRHCRFEKDKPKPPLERHPQHPDRWVVPTKGFYSFTYQPPMSDSLSRQLQLQQQQAGSATPRCKSARGVGGPVRPSNFRMEPQSARGRNAGYGREVSVGKKKDISDDIEDEHDTLDVDWTEVTLVIRDARLVVTPLRYPVIRDMFLSLSTDEQIVRFVHACSKDIGFNSAQVAQLGGDRPEKTLDIVRSLFPGVRGRGSQLLLLVNSGSVTPAQLPLISQELRECIWFQEGNLTGHYCLDLGKPADYYVAENCLLVNAWESEVIKLQGRPDISQRGNFEMLRNESYNDQPFTYTRDWFLPNRGVLRFDYSSARRPPRGTQPMVEAGEVVKHLRSRLVSGEGKLRALRAVSVHCYISTKNFKNWILCFADHRERLDFFCILHTRVVDSVRLLGLEVLHSSAIFSSTDQKALSQRIGCLQLLNPLHPERVEYTCNLLIYEERMVVDFLVQLSLHEPGGKVMDSGKGGASSCISASWTKNGVPAEDLVFTCWYETTSVSINQAWRRQLAELYCGPQFHSEDSLGPDSAESCARRDTRWSVPDEIKKLQST
eukprot:TRINITY_DN26162_c0_g1_i1.p1 TRINITY_DN26162_c0_g1~~TRINITY_DN26162_c0_g1_i1.p1  ORF type:complete len:1468 (-),score=238.13 TRINITY_DN26162_c0_g1_i1:123-3920(-)